MNLFYHDVTCDQSKLKPAKLEQGEVRRRMHTLLLHGQRSSASWDGFDVCCRICPTGVCGVLCRQEFLVPSSGRDRQHGVLQSSLLPGGPWGACLCLLRQVSTPFFCLLLALLFSAKVGSHRSCLVATHLQGLNHHHHF